MRYIKMFEEFSPREKVVVDGKPGRVVSEDGENVTVKFTDPAIIKVIDKSELLKSIKCLSQCNRKIVGEGDDRYIKCTYCGKENRFKKK